MCKLFISLVTITGKDNGISKMPGTSMVNFLLFLAGRKLRKEEGRVTKKMIPHLFHQNQY